MTSLSEPTPVVRPQPNAEPENWAAELRRAIRSPAALYEALELCPENLPPGIQANFPLLVPLPFVRRMRMRDAQDPLLRQVLPQEAEERVVEGFVTDAVGDHQAEVTPGMLQKYDGRALLVAAPACAVHCRYCFRRHYPYEAAPKGIEAWKPALDTIRSDPSIHEVILSGGDPLMLVDASLSRLIDQLDAIAHLRRLRIHTRLPIVIPQRVTDRLVAMLQQTRLTTVMVLHANHANELDDSVRCAAERLVASRTSLLNQSVLLHGVNDSIGALADLSERLIDLGVLPYYLHQLDPVAGTAHFVVPRGQGEKLIEGLRQRLPGYAVPRYVVEQVGEPYKTVIA